MVPGVGTVAPVLAAAMLEAAIVSGAVEHLERHGDALAHTSFDDAMRTLAEALHVAAHLPNIPGFPKEAIRTALLVPALATAFAVADPEAIAAAFGQRDAGAADAAGHAAAVDAFQF